MGNDHEIFYYRSSLLQSIASTASVLGLLTGAVWFNHTFIGGSYFMNGVILVMFLSAGYGMGMAKRRTFTSKKDLLKYLQEDERR